MRQERCAFTRRASSSCDLAVSARAAGLPLPRAQRHIRPGWSATAPPSVATPGAASRAPARPRRQQAPVATRAVSRALSWPCPQDTAHLRAVRDELMSAPIRPSIQTWRHPRRRPGRHRSPASSRPLGRGAGADCGAVDRPARGGAAPSCHAGARTAPPLVALALIIDQDQPARQRYRESAAVLPLVPRRLGR